MNIAGLSKPKVLAALFNRAMPLGLGFMHYKPQHVMDEQEAEQLLSESTFFDYLEGRLMKVDLSTNELRTDLYNRDNGERAAEQAIEKMILESKQ